MTMRSEDFPLLDIKQRSLVVGYRHIGTIYLYHLQESNSPSRTA